MKTIRIGSVLIWLLLVPFALCQEKLIDISTGFKFQIDSTAFSLSFTFNRTASSDADQGPYIVVFPGFSCDDVFGLKPSIESNIGNGVESSPNNVDLDVKLHWRMQLANTSLLLGELAPTASSDKDFKTALLYPSLGIKFLYHNYGDSENFRFYVLPGLNFDFGSRVAKSSTPSSFHRITTSLQFQTTIVSSVDIGLNLQLFVVKNDTTVIADGSYGNMALSATYRFAKKFGLSIKYSIGHNQPLFKKIHTLSIGFAWYR
jgi:hypothetical protein